MLAILLTFCLWITQDYFLSLKIFIYIFWLHGIFTAAYEIFLALCGFFCRGASSRAQGGSAVVALRLSCSTDRGILDLWPEIEPVSPALQGEFSTTGSPRKPLLS